METPHNIDKFQGYPHYPASEDITRVKNNNGRDSLDGESIAPVLPLASELQAEQDGLVPAPEPTDADVTAEDIQMLEAAEENLDTPDNRNIGRSSLDSVDDDGESLNEDGSLRLDVTGEDLDVPGLDDGEEELPGAEDEENSFFSLGGDNHEGQEENNGD